MPAKTLKRVAVAVLVLFLLAVTGLVVMHHTLPVTYGYSVHARCTAMPDDDDAFIAALRQHPGMAEHTVRVWREGDLLRVGFTHVATAAGDPPFPDLDAIARGCGYEVGPGGFTDSPRE